MRVAPLFLLALLAIAWLLPAPDGLRLTAGRDPEVAERVATILDGLPEDAVAVVGFDPDVGTYPEIRPAVRALLAELLDRELALVTVSLTPEGRALLLAELARVEEADPGAGSPIDLGFVPGAEAALVALSRTAPSGLESEELGARLLGRGFRAADLLVVVGGNDIGPRSWIEQVLPRVDETPLIAVAPTVLLPELLPFVESGQIDALAGTPADGAALRSGLLDAGPEEPGDGVAADRPVDRLALLLGVLVAVGVVGHAMVARFAPRLAGQSAGEEA